MSFHNVFVRQCKKIKIESKNNTKAHFTLGVKVKVQMPISTRANMPILTLNRIFLNKEGLERLENFVPKKKSIIEEFQSFQNTQEEDVQVVAAFEAKRNNLEKRLHPKKKVVMVEKGETDGDEKRKKT